MQNFANTAGWLPTIFMIVGIAAMVVFGKYLWSLVNDIHAMAIKVDKLDASIGHERGNPIAHFQMLREIADELKELRQDSERHVDSANKHYDITEQLSRDEVWTRCPMDKCPNMGRFTATLQSLVEKYEQFDKMSVESRNATGAALEGINNQVQQVGKEIGDTFKVLLQIMTDIMMGRK